MALLNVTGIWNGAALCSMANFNSAAREKTLPMPEGTGLDVTFSKSGLKRCHERLLEEGPYDEFHGPCHPGKYLRLPHC